MSPDRSTLLVHLRSLIPAERFFLLLGLVVVFSAVGFWYEGMYWFAVVLLGGLLVVSGVDGYRLYRAAPRVSVVREPPKVFSLGDELKVRLLFHNQDDLPLSLEVVDELPAELQIRDHNLKLDLSGGEKRVVEYSVRPTSRGEYQFGNLNVYLKTRWKLMERALAIPHAQTVAVYPSIVQMKQFALHANASIPAAGRRRPRQLTKSYEFDQIQEYVRGDDIRNVNWKASARRGELMINKYETERSQRIYCLIDKGRTMLMPFAGMSLLDYAINASLALTNVILKRDDRAGLITFSDKLGDVLPADSKPDQLHRVLETLYRQRERHGESDYELLYYAVRRFLPGRSLLFLFSNFESDYALERVLPSLRRIARSHQLVVILFENTEISDLLDEATPDLESVYRKNTARRYIQERQLMATRLRRNGIHVILTKPQALTGAAIDKYLEMKRRGSI